MRSSEDRTLLIEKEPGENLISTFAHLKWAVRSLRARRDLEEQIPLGGWCSWMRGYWERLTSDTSAPDDEEICDLLTPALLVEAKSGWISAYRYKEVPILETGTRSGAVSVWSEINPARLCADLDVVTLQLNNAIGAHL